MIFPIEYDHRQGRSVAPMKRFGASEREKAARERCEIELDLSRGGVDHEVVFWKQRARRPCAGRIVGTSTTPASSRLPPITTYTQDTVLRIPPEPDPGVDRRLLRETGGKVVHGRSG